MSSLITNTSAMVALQTLRTINENLDQANNRVSTGLRVNNAGDNAAYWSIATTTRSDNGALGAVQDSLGLGKSAVDTANTGLDNVRLALQNIKEKLVTASAPDTDRAKIQTEINSLIAQMKSTAESSVISGSSWLSVDSSAANYNATKNVVASFSRTGNSVKVNTIDLDTSTVKLYDANVAVHTAVDAAANTAVSSYNNQAGIANDAYDAAVTNATALGSLDTADTTWQGAIDAADATFAGSAQDAAAITARNTAYGAANTARGTAYTAVTDTSADVEWRKDRMDAETNFYASAHADFQDATDLAAAYATADNTRTAAYAAAEGVRDAAFVAAADLLETAMNTSGADDLGLLDRARTATTSDGKATVSSVADIDISALTGSEADLATIANYMSIVDAALLDMTDASTELGAMTSRIGSQQSFVKALMDANDRAIGSLVDANMEEESTKLKALQTQQQLAIQSLGIANASSQNILQLFRN